jgi:peptidoglycan-associated lipoprotein
MMGGAGRNGAGGLDGAASDPTSPAYFNTVVGDRVLFAVDQSTLSPPRWRRSTARPAG